MALLIVAYPEFRQRDYDWIQTLRARYDQKHYSMLKPHVTLVFPIEDMSEKKLIDHVQAIVSTVAPIPFVMHSASINYNRFLDCWHVFLIPDEGNGRLSRMHDSLYTGILADKWLLEIPYIPHVTVATLENCQECKDLTAELNREELAIDGIIETLDIVCDRDGGIEPIRRIGLTGKVE